MIRPAVKSPRAAASRPLPVRIRRSKVDAFVIVIIWLVSIAAPWCIGGVHDAVFAFAGVAALVAIAALMWGHWNSLEVPRCSPPRMIWVFLLPFVLGLLQLTPLPDVIHSRLSPASVEMRHRLQTENESDAISLGGTSTRGGAGRRNCVSLSPSETKKELSRYWVPVAFLIMGVFSLSQSKWLPFYFGSLAANGVAIAFFALIQKLSWNGKMFWSLEVPWFRVLGPFVNKNNGAGYLLMILAVVMAMLFQRISSKSDLQGTLRETWLRLMNDNKLMFVLGALLLIWIAIVVSMSRGAFGGAVVATLVTVVFVWRHSRGIAIAMGVVSTILVAALIVWSGQTNDVQNRIASIGEKVQYRDVRFGHWADDLNMSRDFVLTGCGIGAYPNAQRAYQRVPLQGWFRYSENQYIESLVVGGLFGLTLLLVFLGIVWQATVRLTIHGRNNPRIARYATLGVFLLVAQMIAAFFDFGLYNVPNACLMACLTGVILSKAHTILPQKPTSNTPLELRRSFQLLMIVTLCVGIWSVWQLVGAAGVEWAMNGFSLRAEVLDAGPHTPKHQLDAEIKRLNTALRFYPEHALGQARLANLHVMRFRLDFFDELKASADAALDEKQLWTLTQLRVVRSIVHGGRDDATGDDPRPIFDDESYQRHLIPAWNALLASRSICPMLPRVHYRLALLSPMVDASTRDVTRHLDRTILMAPQSASLHFHSGQLMIEHGERQTGLKWMKKAAQAKKRMPANVATFVKNYLTPRELVNSVMPDDPEFILDAISQHFRSDEDLRWRLALGMRSLELLETVQEEDRTAIDIYRLARSRQFIGQSRLACESYRAAIEIEPGVAHWRFGYAETLSEMGDLDSALREARLCERMLPNSWKVRQLVYRIQKLQRDQS